MDRPMNEATLREVLKDVILEMYGLSPTPVRRSERPRSVASPKAKPHPTFSTGSAPRAGRFASEGSAIPGRQKVLVGTSVRKADNRRRRPTERLPGESDRDFLDRRSKLRRLRSLGLKAPSSDRIKNPNSTDEWWEMGQ